VLIAHEPAYRASPSGCKVYLVHPLLHRALTTGASLYSHSTLLADMPEGFYDSFHPDLGAIR
jgi:hypothetical protein